MNVSLIHSNKDSLNELHCTFQKQKFIEGNFLKIYLVFEVAGADVTHN